MKLAVSAAATAVALARASSSSAPTLDELRDFTVADVDSMLASNRLADVFGPAFAKAGGMDGLDLLEATPTNLEDVFPGIADLYWNRLYRLLRPAWRASGRPAGDDPLGLAPNGSVRGKSPTTSKDGAEAFAALDGHGRLLAATPHLDLSRYRGLKISRKEAMVMFSDDMVVARTEDGLVVAAPNVNMTGDLTVTGSIINEEFAGIVDAALALGTGLDAAEADISDLQNAASDVAGNVNSLQTAATAAAGAIDDLEADSAALHDTVDSLGARATTAETDISVLEQDVDALTKDVSTLEGDVADLQDVTATVQGAVQTAVGGTALGHSEANPALSCRHILQMGGSVHNGHYWITRVGKEDAYKACVRACVRE
jgi:hypothetical protein